MTSIISIKNLSKRYKGSERLALHDLNLIIQKGEFFGLLGPNGSGKTTLISILCGLIEASSGEVIIAGEPIPKHIDKVKKNFNLVPQEIALYPSLTLKENINFFGKMYDLNREVLRERSEECLHISGLKNFVDEPVSTFSGGMQRRANLIMSLINHPQILFLDEPAAHVDPQSRELIFEILSNLNKQGTTIIYTTHYLEEAQHLCNRVAILDSGTVLCNDSPEELIKNSPGANNLSDVFFQLTGKELRDIEG
ncbi:MAG: ABC transporter ATP-binding protein [Proteobacteria bacterium]|nr:ABC transporter ATP-binding protein [Pseudomonadota bacterium]